MAETKQYVELSARFKEGERAYLAWVIFGDTHDATIEDHKVGTFRSMAAAKQAVRRELAEREAAETRDGWWTGQVETGHIVDTSFFERGYGYVKDWSWETLMVHKLCVERD